MPGRVVLLVQFIGAGLERLCLGLQFLDGGEKIGAGVVSGMSMHFSSSLITRLREAKRRQSSH